MYTALMFMSTPEAGDASSLNLQVFHGFEQFTVFHCHSLRFFHASTAHCTAHTTVQANAKTARLFINSIMVLLSLDYFTENPSVRSGVEVDEEPSSVYVGLLQPSNRFGFHFDDLDCAVFAPDPEIRRVFRFVKPDAAVLGRRQQEKRLVHLALYDFAG